MTKIVRWLRLLCPYCKYKTIHRCIADEVQSLDGLLWQCVSCRRSEARTAHDVSTGERL